MAQVWPELEFPAAYKYECKEIIDGRDVSPPDPTTSRQIAKRRNTIIAAVLGTVFGIALLVVVFFWIRREHRKEMTRVHNTSRQPQARDQGHSEQHGQVNYLSGVEEGDHELDDLHPTTQVYGGVLRRTDVGEQPPRYTRIPKVGEVPPEYGKFDT